VAIIEQSVRPGGGAWLGGQLGFPHGCRKAMHNTSSKVLEIVEDLIIQEGIEFAVELCGHDGPMGGTGVKRLRSVDELLHQRLLERAKRLVFHGLRSYFRAQNLRSFNGGSVLGFLELAQCPGLGDYRRVFGRIIAGLGSWPDIARSWPDIAGFFSRGLGQRYRLQVLSLNLNVGQFSDLADLISRINYNNFYMSDNYSNYQSTYILVGSIIQDQREDDIANE
ncbi:hypothetical protein Tco_1063613, partial [Tanacetum coccineum]